MLYKASFGDAFPSPLEVDKVISDTEKSDDDISQLVSVPSRGE